MLLRTTDPFRDLDRLAQQVFGTTSRPAVMPMDAWHEGDRFVIESDLPGVARDSIDLDVERNVLTIRAQRVAPNGDWEALASERPRGVFSRQLVLGDQPGPGAHRGRLRRRRAATGRACRGEGEAPQDRGDSRHDRGPRRGPVRDQRLTEDRPSGSRRLPRVRWQRQRRHRLGPVDRGDRHLRGAGRGCVDHHGPKPLERTPGIA
jgi:HSP20 family molecular chaperone IbpA